MGWREIGMESGNELSYPTTNDYMYWPIATTLLFVDWSSFAIDFSSTHRNASQSATFVLGELALQSTSG